MLSAIYIHIPFCLHKCGYCDFNSFASEPQSQRFQLEARRYVRALLTELKFKRAEFEAHEREGSLSRDWSYVSSRTIPTVFLGGGTPSLLSFELLKELFHGLFEEISIRPQEITLESNPETVTEELIENLQSLGVTRVSFGIQSFRPKALKALERQHTPSQSFSTLRLLKGSKLRWSGDFIYGVPGLHLNEFLEDLDLYFSFGPRHLSAYQLTLKPGHLLYHRLPSDDEAHEWFESTHEFCRSRGLSSYEVSNFAKSPHDVCFHNQNTWKSFYFLGLGAGASSFLPYSSFGVLGKNLTDVASYCQTVESGLNSFRLEEELGFQEAVFQSYFLGLRTHEGVSLTECSQRYGETLESLMAPVLESWQKHQLIDYRAGKSLRLKPQGMSQTDSLCVQLLSEIQKTSRQKRPMSRVLPLSV